MKNPWAITDQEVYRAGMETFVDESKGMIRLIVVKRNDVPGLYAAAKAGDDGAARVAIVIGKTLRALTERKPPFLCMTCDRTATPKRVEGFAIMMPLAAIDGFESAVASPICRVCLAKSQSQLQKKIVAVLSKNFGFAMWLDENEKT